MADKDKTLRYQFRVKKTSAFSDQNSAPFLEALLENLDDCVVACDASGNLTTFNGAARRIHGLPEAPIPASQWAEHYHLFMADGVTPLKMQDIPLFRALQGENVREVEIVIQTQGEKKLLSCSGQAIYDSEGNKLGAVVTMHDITATKRAHEELQTFKRQLEERVQLRTEELLKANQELSQEINIRKRTEAALTESEKRFRTLFEQSPLSVQLLSVDGRTIQVNTAWKELWGMPEDFIQNFILKQYNMLEDPQLEAKGILSIIKEGFQGRSRKIPAILYDPTEEGMEGRGRWVEAFIHPIFDENGKVQEVVLIHQDVTDKVQSDIELKSAMNAAEEANRLKSAFLANMSHEIRTPLSAILGFTDLLLEMNLHSTEATEYLSIIERNGKALTQVIDDILDLSKVEAGQMKIEMHAVDPHAVLKEVTSLLSIQAAKKGLNIETLPNEGSPTTIQTDPMRLKQILINLLGNAIKFTDAGSIQIKTEKIQKEDKNYLKLSVTHTGVGIAPELQSFLFRPFSQVDSSNTRKFGGTGLGLALSRRLAHAMGGEIDLEKSAPNQGSVFSLILPLTPVLKS